MIKKFRSRGLWDSTCFKWISTPEIEKESARVLVLVRWWVMQRDAGVWCHSQYTLKHTCNSAAHMSLCVFIHIRCTVSLPLSLFLSPAVVLSLCHPFPNVFSRPLTNALPPLLQMGWVESWLRTFMPKTTCHPSLLLSRMVMLLEVRWQVI